MPVILELSPVSVSYGHPIPPFSASSNITEVDSPTPVGGGSLTDNSDASYVEIGTWAEPSGGGRIDHVEPVSATFVLPPGYENATAVAVKLRIRSSPSALIPTPDQGPAGVSVTLVDEADDTEFGSLVASSSGSPLFEITTASLSAVSEYAFWFGEVDLGNPTDAGGWFEFALDADVSAEVVAAALVGDGMRASIAVYSGIVLDNDSPHRRPWLELYEFRLLVACEAASAVGIFPLRRYPPVNNGGFGPTRHYPRSPGRRAGKSY